MLNVIIAISIPLIIITVGFTLGLLLTNLIDYRALTARDQDELYLKYSKGSRELASYKIPKFTFHQFLTFYGLNPNSWELKTEYDQYVPAKKELTKDGYVNGRGVYTYVSDGMRFIPMSTIMHPIFFKNFFEYLKYKRWVKHTLRANQVAEINEAQLHNTQTIINLVQKDIDKMMEENHKTIEETAAQVADVYVRLNQEATKR